MKQTLGQKMNEQIIIYALRYALRWKRVGTRGEWEELLTNL